MLDDEGRLVDDSPAATMFASSCWARDQLLMVTAAVGISAEAAATASQLLDITVGLDTAHSHQRRMLEAIRAVKAVVENRVPLMGNVCTAEGTRA